MACARKSKATRCHCRVPGAAGVMSVSRIYPAHMREWRDYLAFEESPDGTRTILGGLHARVGSAFEAARQIWPEVFSAGRGRIVPDHKAGAIAADVARELAHE